MHSAYRTKRQERFLERTSQGQMDQAFRAAWKLVRSHGLSKTAYYRADYEMVCNAFYLIAQGVPVKRVVRLLNGKQAKLKLEAARERLVRVQMAALKNSETALTAAHLSSLLAKLAPGALLAELQCADVDLVTRAYLVWLRQPRDVKRRILSRLPRRAVRDAWFDAAATSRVVKEHVGTETVISWLREG